MWWLWLWLWLWFCIVKGRGAEGGSFQLQLCDGLNLTEKQEGEVKGLFMKGQRVFGENATISFSSQSCSPGFRLPLNESRLLSPFHERESQSNPSTSGPVILHQICIAPEIRFPSTSVTSLAYYQCSSHSPSRSRSRSRNGNPRSLTNCTEQHPCTRKCCELDEIFNLSNNSCERSGERSNYTWSPTLYTFDEEDQCIVKVGVGGGGGSVLYKVGGPENCDAPNWTVVPSKNIPGEYGLGRFRMMVDGSVLVHYANGSWVPLSIGSYCIDLIHLRNKWAKVLLVCQSDYQVQGRKLPIPLGYAAMLYSSIAILFAVVVIYLLIWDLHSVYEWTVFFEVLAMIFMIIFVSVAHNVAREPSDGLYGSKLCIFVGASSHFFTLSTFFWLFLINVEIWWNFRSLTLKNKKSRKWLRMLMYQLFGWGLPALFVSIGLLLDFMFGLQNDTIDCPSLILPNYGQVNCNISKIAQGPYVYYPIGILLGFNLLFYSMTVLRMCQYQKNSQQINRHKSSGHFQPVVVFARLFIVMGVSWCFQVGAWALKPLETKGTTPIYWIVFDVVTLVQGIAIFIIFICKKDVVKRLMEKYPKSKGILEPLSKLCGAAHGKGGTTISGRGHHPSTTPTAIATASTKIKMEPVRGTTRRGGGGGGGGGSSDEEGSYSPNDLNVEGTP